MTSGSKRETIGDYLLTFAPWIAYVILTEAADSWRLGFAIGLTISAGTVAWRTLCRDSRFIDVGTLCYCAAMTAVSMIYPDSPLRPYNIPLSAVAVGLLSLASVISGSPFTYRIARDKVPGWILEDPAQHARLLRAHMTATKSWAAAQTAAGTLGAAFIGTKLAPAAVTVEVIGTLTPVGITRFQHERFINSVAPSDHPAAAPDSEADDQNAVAKSDEEHLDEEPVPDRRLPPSNEAPSRSPNELPKAPGKSRARSGVSGRLVFGCSSPEATDQ
jgi:hypothetical protein